MNIMNELENIQKQGTKHWKDTAPAIASFDLTKMAKPVGNFGGRTDFILRLGDGELVPANTGDQGGGQN
jgi:hypothetical protein